MRFCVLTCYLLSLGTPHQMTWRVRSLLYLQEMVDWEYISHLNRLIWNINPPSASPPPSMIRSSSKTISTVMRSSQINWQAKAIVRQQNKERIINDITELTEQLSADVQRSVKLAKEKCSSSWLTALPLKAHSFVLHKQAFRDGLALHYGCTPKTLPSKCACSSSFTVDHALSPATASIRHIEIRDLMANLLRYVINYALNRNSCQYWKKTASANKLVLMHNQEHGLTSLLTVYGEAPLNEPTWTSGYSTLMPHLTDIWIRKQSTESTNSKKSEPTNNIFQKSNMHNSPRWFCLLQEG